MDLETVRFFHEKGLGISKIIDVAPKSLTPQQVEIAAERVYKKIQGGEQIEDRDLDWTVLAEAKQVKAEEYLEEQEILADVNEVIKRIRWERQQEITTLKNTIYEVDRYYQNQLTSINSQLRKIGETVSKLEAKEDLNELWLHIVESISPATD